MIFPSASVSGVSTLYLIVATALFVVVEVVVNSCIKSLKLIATASLHLTNVKTILPAATSYRVDMLYS